MPHYRRNSYDLTELRIGDKLIWNEREETGTVTDIMEYGGPVMDGVTVTVETQRGAEVRLIQNPKQGDKVLRAGGKKEPLRYVEIL